MTRVLEKEEAEVGRPQKRRPGEREVCRQSGEEHSWQRAQALPREASVAERNEVGGGGYRFVASRLLSRCSYWSEPEEVTF